MRKFLSSLVAIAVCATLFLSCNDDSDSQSIEDLRTNAWSFDNGKVVKAGSVLIMESAGQVKALFSEKSGLTSILDFDSADDCTEISFPKSAIGTTINLTKLTDAEADTYIISRLAGFGNKYGLVINNASRTVSEGTITSSLDNGVITIKCEFTTLDKGVKFDVNLQSKLKTASSETTESYIDYDVKSRDITKSTTLSAGFYLKDTWDEGWTFTYSVADIRNYIQLGNNTFVEVFVGSPQLLNGKPFDIAKTTLPFSLKFEYLDFEQQRTVPVVVDNTDRSGATGTITLTQNSKGTYDAEFDVTLNNGDITVKGFYGGDLHNRNMIYDSQKGNVAAIRSATLDISSDPCYLYLSTKTGTAGPEQYDIKCQVEKNEWRYGKFMAFSGQGSSIKWIDGVTYDRTTTSETTILGGNWRVSQPTVLSNGVNLSECCVSLYGAGGNSYAYYYGEIKVVK